MIQDPLLAQLAEETGEELILHLLDAFDEATRRGNADPGEAILREAMRILQERINALAEHQG